MNKISIVSALAAFVLAAAPGCRKDDIISIPGSDSNLTYDTDSNSSSSSSSDVDEVDPFNASDDVATFTPEGTVNVVFSQGAVTLDGDLDHITYTADGAGLTVINKDTVAIKYVLSGSSSNGFFKLYSEKKQLLELSSLSLANPAGAAINNQSGKRTYVVLTGSSSLADGASYTATPSDEDEKAAFFSEGQLCFSGSGSLTVTAKGKAGITSDDYIRFLGGTVSASSSSGHGIRGKDAVVVSAGTVTAKSSADMKKAVSTDGFYQQDGGTVTLEATGSAAYDSEDGDYSGAACIKADGDFVMNGGALTCTATGSGGKGISCDGTGFFNGGTVNASAAGTDFTKGSVHPKAIKCDGDIEVTGGDITVSSSRHEAMTTGGTWTQGGGSVIAGAYDDAINSAGTMTITGGCLYGRGTNNDGIDANAAIYISGGIVIGVGTKAPETGIDSVEGTTVTVSGGYVISQGGDAGAFSFDDDMACVSTTLSSGTKIALNDGSKFLMAYAVPSGGTTTRIITPDLKSGSSYTLYKGVSFTPQYLGCFALDGISGGSASGTLSASSASSSGGPGGGGPGGGGGHGPGGW